jgi:AcrR family transcriptional regulator
MERSDLDAAPASQRARRERILRAALDALDEGDYERIQPREIAQSAGVALATLYRYFPSKEHLYAQVLVGWAGVRKVVAALPGDAAGDERVRQWMHRVIAAFERQPRMFKVQALLYKSSDPAAKALLRDLAADITASLVREFRYLGPGADADAATMLWAIIDTSLASVAYRGLDIAEAYRLADTFVDLVTARAGGEPPAAP